MLKQKIYLIIIVLCIFQLSFGQKKEFYVNSYAGIFSFRGNSADNTSGIVYYAPPYTIPYNANDLNNISYATKSGFSFMIEVQGQMIFKNRNIVGLGISFEKLVSQVYINKVVSFGVPGVIFYDEKGIVNQKFSFINLNPYIGHRYFYKKLKFDLTAGCDFGFNIKSKEIGGTTNNYNGGFKVDNKKPVPSVDIRPRLQLKSEYKRCGILLGYSLGISNYIKYNDEVALSNLWRFGISYKLR